MQAVILIGGRGSRLGALSDSLPKPLQPMSDGRPFLDFVLDWLAGHGVEDVILLSGHLADVVEAHYRSASPCGLQITTISEPRPLGTAGAIKNAQTALDERFLVLNGDSLFDFDLAAFIAAADPERAVTLALRKVEDASRYGAVMLDGDAVVGFREKTGRSEPGVINAGVYLMRRSFIEALPSGPRSLENDLFPQLAEAGRLGGQVHEGYFIDIGLPETLAEARRDLAPLQMSQG